MAKKSSGIAKFFRDIKNSSKKTGKQMGAGFKKVGTSMKGGFTKIGDGFTKIGGEFTKIGNKILEVELVFKCIANIFESLKSYVDCFFGKIASFPQCFIYYVLQIIYYITISLSYLTIIYFCSPLKTPLDYMYNFLMKVDKMIYKNAEIHIFDFQESVKDKCFRCTQLKPFPDFSNLKKCGKKSKKNKNITKCDNDDIKTINKTF